MTGGNLTVHSGHTLYGIWIVYGDVTLLDSSRIEGVLYMPTAGSTLRMERDDGGNFVNGGVVGNVDIDQSGGSGYRPYIRYDAGRMQVFASYRTFPSAIGDMRPFLWTYE